MYLVFLFMAAMSGVGFVGTSLFLTLQLDAKTYLLPLWGGIALISAIIATVVMVREERELREWRRKKREETS